MGGSQPRAGVSACETVFCLRDRLHCGLNVRQLLWLVNTETYKNKEKKSE